ncbi:MAG: hypothetical protein ACI8ZM_005628 [Crocinitomix sp.]|jgi:hypothetical protein
MKKHRNISLTFMMFCFFISTAQENNYWSVKQGAIASLTGGAVIANTSNQTAAYYNPGLLPFIKSNSVSLNASTYFLKSASIENGAGKNIDLEYARFGVVPQNIFGILDITKNDKLTLSYAILSEMHSEINFAVRNEFKIDISDIYPGNETYLGGYKYYNKLRENWYGLAAGYELSDQFGVGFSTFIVANNLDYSEARIANVIVEDDTNNFVRTIINSSLNEDLTYSSLGVLMKLGLSYKLDKLRLGLTLTSPLLNINFLGKATVTRGVYISTDDNSLSNINQVSFQEKINTTNKKPLTIDFGATYSFPKTDVSFRAAYYGAIDTYDLIDKNDFDNSSNFDQIEDFGIPQMAKNSVTNIGVGLIQELSEKMSLYAGFSTDFNNFDESKLNRQEDFVPSIGYWDLYHYSLGLSNRLKHFQLVYGLTYMTGRSQGDVQIINISDPIIDNLFFGELTQDTKTTVNEINLNIGFIYYFH